MAPLPAQAAGSAPYLQDDLAPQLRGRGQLLGQLLHRLGQQLISEDVLEDARHLALLLDGAVLLDGQDEREAEEQRKVRCLAPPPPPGSDRYDSHSEATKAWSFMAFTTSSNLILVVLVQPW